jgi:hypothetical protein
MSHPYFPHEPVGLSQLVNCNFDTPTGGGQLTQINGGGSSNIVTDLTAPASPTNVVEHVFPAGSGIGDNTLYRDLPSVNEVFIGLAWKMNANFFGTPNFGNKLFFLKTDDMPSFFAAYGGGFGDFALRWNSQNVLNINNCHLAGAQANCVAGTSWGIPTLGSAALAHNVWHRLEVYAVRSTSRTSQNGILRIWLNNNLIANWTTVNWGNGGFVQFHISHTWNNLSNPNTSGVDWIHYFDHAYLSASSGASLGPVLETNEWNNKTQANWAYATGATGLGAAIDPVPSGGSSPGSTGVSNSGGSALRMQWNAGNYTASVPGGRAEYTYSPGLSELYWGRWSKWSTGFTWHPIANKTDYFKCGDISPSIGQVPYVAFRVHNSGLQDLRVDIGIGVQGTGNPHTLSNNIAPVIINSGIWYWFEYRIKLNTPITSQNGIVEAWLNGTLVMSYSNIRITDVATTLRVMEHSPEWGGGGVSTIPATQYHWVDHTVLSTTPIGVPGGGSPSDITPPTTPTGLQVI